MSVPYGAPSIRVAGSLAELTLATTCFDEFDGNFVAGEPVPVDPNGVPLIGSC